MDRIEIKDREQYIDIQINRSRSKFAYCKVNVSEVMFFHNLLKPILGDVGPILCLGTRNGREIDLFRNIFFGNKYLNKIISMLKLKHLGYRSRWPFVESLFRSNLNETDQQAVFGVELNPDAKRQDTWIGSFDQMPKEWSGKFSVLYSNSFDQSHDPFRTAAEWKRVLLEGGIIILGFSETEPTESDPVGNLTYYDLLKIFDGELIFFSKYGFHYSYVVLRL